MLDSSMMRRLPCTVQYVVQNDDQHDTMRRLPCMVRYAVQNDDQHDTMLTVLHGAMRRAE